MIGIMADTEPKTAKQNANVPVPHSSLNPLPDCDSSGEFMTVIFLFGTSTKAVRHSTRSTQCLQELRATRSIHRRPDTHSLSPPATTTGEQPESARCTESRTRSSSFVLE